MVFFWTYIDDIVGKGVGLGLLTELVFYLSVSMVPMALSIAVLISSVMVMGNLAEHYELASLKSAGIPLWRVMVPLMVVASTIAVFSFFCSNNLIPIANLQFKSRLYDIRKQKPTLSLEKGIFNYDFKGFVIRIGEKGTDNRSIGDVLIYDHNKYNKGGVTRILAENGEMYTTDDKKFFVMNLTNGTQYQEINRKGQAGKDKSYPFVRTNFKEWSKVFDLQEFEIGETDKNLFKSHQSMLTSAQLVVAIDSLEESIQSKYTSIHNTIFQSYYPYKKLVIQKEVPKKKPTKKVNSSTSKNTNKKPSKTTKNKTTKKKTPVIKKTKKTPKQIAEEKEKMKQKAAELIKKARADRIAPEKNASAIAPEKTEDTPKSKATTSNKKASATKPKKNKTTKVDTGKNPVDKKTKEKIEKKKEKSRNQATTPIEQIIDKPLSAYSSWAETLPKRERIGLYSRAKSTLRTLSSQSESTARNVDRLREARVKHVFMLHEKFSMAIACIIFLFIGAPMGAIIRKGGFGYPILVSILFFISFIVMNIFCKKVAETFVLEPVFAAWLPNLILFPIGLILTYRAMNDSKIINIDKYTAFIKRLFSKKNSDVATDT